MLEKSKVIQPVEFACAPVKNPRMHGCPRHTQLSDGAASASERPIEKLPG